MRKQSEIESLVRRLYQQLGKDPAELLQIKPVDGDWGNALSYEVTRSDKKRARIWRRDLDDSNDQNVKASLSAFS